MFKSPHRPQTDPVDIYRVRDGIYAADMLLTAIVHLDLFSWLDVEARHEGGRLPRVRGPPTVRPM